MTLKLSRRGLLSGIAASSTLALGGCDALGSLSNPDNKVRGILASANDLTYHAQRLLLGNNWLAPEFPESDIREGQKPNGTTDPQDEDYLKLASSNFSDYQLEVGGLVENKQSLSLEKLRAMPSRTQITRHDCVEGWSCIAKWTGVPLSTVLKQAKPKPEAKYVVFNCFDTMEQGLDGSIKYYGSIDLIDAYHPQSILAYDLNGQTLPVSNGAPLRVRVERQLGYKMNKYIRSIDLVSSLGKARRGQGRLLGRSGI